MLRTVKEAILLPPLSRMNGVFTVIYLSIKASTPVVLLAECGLVVGHPRRFEQALRSALFPYFLPTAEPYESSRRE